MGNSLVGMGNTVRQCKGTSGHPWRSLGDIHKISDPRPCKPCQQDSYPLVGGHHGPGVADIACFTPPDRLVGALRALTSQYLVPYNPDVHVSGLEETPEYIRTPIEGPYSSL